MEAVKLKKKEAVILTADEIFRIRHTFPAISWSSYNGFTSPYPNAKEKWYDSYVLGKKTTSRELEFGKRVADSMATSKPLAPFTRMKEIEHEFDVLFEGIRIVGSMDTFEPPIGMGKRKVVCGEFKTGRVAWDQDRADAHGQLKMYALLLWLSQKIRPEDQRWFLEWCPTCETGDFKIDFVRPIRIYRFEVKITMVDILRFASEVKKVHKEMLSYVRMRQKQEGLCA